MVKPDDVIDALSQVVDPEKEKSIVRLNMLKNLKIKGDKVSFTLVFKDPLSSFAQVAETLCRDVIRKNLGQHVNVVIRLDNEMISLGDNLMVNGSGNGSQKDSEAPKGVINFIAVASGKGGVGKSTVAANLAVALAGQGYDVGLVDTDIYGPSIPMMFGLRDERPRVNEHQKVVPPERFGVKLLSMGFLVDPSQAVIWRGPMVSSAVRQFLSDAEWGDLDYLIMDLPPGTGDIQLTIVQTIALTGAIIVSTPQEVALADARKGVSMFRNVNVPVLGMIENMAYFTPPELPDRKYYLFGREGAQQLAGELDVPFLGDIPIEQVVRENCDDGTPVVVATPDSVSAKAFNRIAEHTARQVALRNAMMAPTPKVEIQRR